MYVLLFRCIHLFLLQLDLQSSALKIEEWLPLAGSNSTFSATPRLVRAAVEGRGGGIDLLVSENDPDELDKQMEWFCSARIGVEKRCCSSLLPW
jgi:hypothetical protein